MTEPRGDDDRDVSKAAAVVGTAILLALSLAGVAAVLVGGIVVVRRRR